MKTIISSKATVSKRAKIGKHVTICDYAVVNDNVVIGDNCYIGKNVILGEPLAAFYTSKNYRNPLTRIGKGSLLRSGTIVYAGCVLGDGFRSGHNAIVREYSRFDKNCSFGTYSVADGHVKVGCNCGFHNNVFIASYTTIRNNVSFYPFSLTLDSPHPPCRNCRKGPTIENDVVISARAVILPHVKLGRKAVVGAGSLVTKDVPAGKLAYGSPADVVSFAKNVHCKKNTKHNPYL